MYGYTAFGCIWTKQSVSVDFSQQSTNAGDSGRSEADAHYSCLVGHTAEGPWLQLAPLRMLSIHLRTVGTEGLDDLG